MWKCPNQRFLKNSHPVELVVLVQRRRITRVFTDFLVVKIITPKKESEFRFFPVENPSKRHHPGTWDDFLRWCSFWKRLNMFLAFSSWSKCFVVKRSVWNSILLRPPSRIPKLWETSSRNCVVCFCYNPENLTEEMVSVFFWSDYGCIC